MKPTYLLTVSIFTCAALTNLVVVVVVVVVLVAAAGAVAVVISTSDVAVVIVVEAVAVAATMPSFVCTNKENLNTLFCIIQIIH